MTQSASKKTFLKYLDKILDDSDIIILSNELNGTMSVSKKRNEKKLPFVFAADAFSDADSISSLILRKTPYLAFIICKPEDVSEPIIEKIKREESQA